MLQRPHAVSSPGKPSLSHRERFWFIRHDKCRLAQAAQPMWLELVFAFAASAYHVAGAITGPCKETTTALHALISVGAPGSKAPLGPWGLRARPPCAISWGTVNGTIPSLHHPQRFRVMSQRPWPFGGNDFTGAVPAKPPFASAFRPKRTRPPPKSRRYPSSQHSPPLKSASFFSWQKI